MAATHSGALAEAAAFHDAVKEDLEASEAEVGTAAKTIAALEMQVVELQGKVQQLRKDANNGC
ncbi:MAG: hypothetical protein QGD90_00275 [Candidatus Hydrogenedentes bacterium]|nr:hypothetical protein [Candidatus Hydrogenedentota bacterium]